MIWQGKIDFQKPITINGKPHGIEHLVSLPTWTVADEGRAVHAEDTGSLWFGTSTGWAELTPGGVGAHDHNDLYYTETEVDAMFEGKSGEKQIVDWVNINNKPSFASAIHGDEAHSEVYLKSGDVNYTFLDNQGLVGPGINQVAQGTHSHTATSITYDNTTSGLAAVDIQDAIDELDGSIDAIAFDANEISYDNTTSSLSAVDVQAAIDELSAEKGVEFDGITYVSKSGSDTDTGVVLGTMDNPFLTVQAAIDTAAAIGGYQIVFVGPGLYTENIVLPPYVALYSYGKEPTRIGTGNTANTHTIDFSAAGGRVFIKNINLRNDGLLIDHPATGAGGVSVWLDNSNFGQMTFNGLGINDYIQIMESCWAFGDVIIHSANGDIRDSFISGSLVVDDTGGVDANGDGRYGNIDVKGSEIFETVNITGAMSVRLGHTFTYTSPATIDGALALFEYDVVSGPDSVSVLNGATVDKLSDAVDLKYDNTTSGLTATDVQEAIDEVEANNSVFDLTTGVPADTPVVGTHRFDADTNTLYVYNGSAWVSTILS